jgi:predicted dienelactone hydrolase
MQQMSLARLLVSVAALGVTLAAVETARGAVIASPDEVVQLAGRNVAIWRPSGSAGPHPLVLFSHGAGGCNTQSTYLMHALASAGMLVAAPDHAADKGTSCPNSRPRLDELPRDLMNPNAWGPTFHDDRRDDLQALREALEDDPTYAGLIDPERVVLVGHSLGGYTALGLAGAWPAGWKMGQVAAVVALAPFAKPFMRGATPAGIDVPVLFQFGVEDNLAPLADADAIFGATSAVTCKVVYQDADHFAWIDLTTDFHMASAAATVAFLDEVFAGRSPKAAILASSQTDGEEDCQ